MNSPASRSTIAWLLFTSDIIGLLFCFNLAFLLRLEEIIDWRSPILYGLILVYLLGLYLADTYRLEIKLSGLWTSERVLFGILATVTVITSCIYLTGLWGSEPIVGRGILFISVGFFTIWAIAWRLLTGKWVKITEAKSRFLVLGSGEQALRFGLEYQSFHAKTDFVFLTKNNLEINQKLETEQNLIIDNFDNFSTWSKQSWSGVLIDDTVDNLSNEMIRELMEMRLKGVYVYSLANFCEQYWQKIPPSYIQDDWFAFTSGFSILHNRINIKLKKVIDKVAAGLLLILTFPLFVLVAIAIKLDSPGAILYSQVRTGLNGKKFKVYKFRSMCQNAEKQGIQWAKKRDPRITRVGFFLRLSRIDELPQIWNVLKGDMSLVGPRPERPEFDLQLREEIPYYDVRYLVKPGITGWAQVCYPYGSSVEDAYQKVAYDLYYIKNYSLLLDLKIAFKTLRVMILGKGR
ncbi:exopolysaccharide biosynthesis polyprenyl glycosylphosphotransferase [Stanieria cyanosphaera PCC 7437]|uniref:Exopolysaccharide biosynthesis polyprenyl glycosylphosphotransferase n=1 Tax=Stanieria cyanosphaera (strain ATCC 29371 / PCC 7437) TaxID=111780 RepID=K9XS85_STAC7|nr:sugar transferase [Stanieria cyanosphaera]AFZ34532.1 exopolysaccharide biosynthesis polyprenyl glycosylphosphotransferase [Stanieria cyanosphaera PCC 7437]